MKKQIKKYKNFKISVHIPLYLETRKKKQFQNFRKVCDAILKLSEKVKIFVHTNKKLKNHNKFSESMKRYYLTKFKFTDECTKIIHSSND